MQTNHKLITSIKHYNSICSILEKNPEFEYIFFDDKRCRDFLIENYQVNILSNEPDNNQDSDVVRAFDYILPGAIKADFFRYCYLYIKGGIYIDSKVISNVSFNELIKENDELISKFITELISRQILYEKYIKKWKFGHNYM
jgi:mannosyltransferase OCH1-like enzyme